MGQPSVKAVGSEGKENLQVDDFGNPDPVDLLSAENLPVNTLPTEAQDTLTQAAQAFSGSLAQPPSLATGTGGESQFDYQQDPLLAAAQEQGLQRSAYNPRPRMTKGDFFKQALSNFMFSFATGMANAGTGPGANARGFGAAALAPYNRQVFEEQRGTQRALQAYQLQRQAQLDELERRNVESQISYRSSQVDLRRSPQDQKVDEGFNDKNQRIHVYRTPQGKLYNVVVPDIVRPEARDTEKQQDITDWLEARKLPNTAANRDKAREAIIKRGPRAVFEFRERQFGGPEA